MGQLRAGSQDAYRAEIRATPLQSGRAPKAGRCGILGAPGFSGTFGAGFVGS